MLLGSIWESIMPFFMNYIDFCQIYTNNISHHQLQHPLINGTYIYVYQAFGLVLVISGNISHNQLQYTLYVYIYIYIYIYVPISAV